MNPKSCIIRHTLHKLFFEVYNFMNLFLVQICIVIVGKSNIYHYFLFNVQNIVIKIRYCKIQILETSIHVIGRTIESILYEMLYDKINELELK